MPVACGETVLSGSSGSAAFKPAGTTVCLEDSDDFPANPTAVITVPAGHGFIVGDQVTFWEEDGGQLDTGLTPSTTGNETAYLITAATTAAPWTVTVTLASAPATAVELDGDGGTGGANSTGHINMQLSDFTSVCNVTNFSLSLDRGQLETTSLSCGCGSDTNGLAPFKTYQAGYIDSTGTLEVQFTEDQSSMASRLLNSSLKTQQDGAAVRLYINTVCAGGNIDNTASSYIEGPITILGFSFSVTPDEVTTATVNFALSGQPTAFSL